jgi:hypothetical protein
MRPVLDGEYGVAVGINSTWQVSIVPYGKETPIIG